jgi:putative ABC transport system permease protein
VPAEVDDEIRLHIDLAIQRYIALGMSEAEARRHAVSRFGDVALIRDDLIHHDLRKAKTAGRKSMVADFLQDLRFGWRGLRRAPAFAITATLTLALGIGANAAIFSVVNSVLLKALPYESPEDLVVLGSGTSGEFVGLRERLRGVSELGAYVAQTHPFDDGQHAARVEGAAITTNMLRTLGVAPAFGRDFTETEGQLGRNDVLLISHGMWQRQFGGSKSVLGRRVTVEGAPFTIVGVMPRDFRFPSKETEYWQPLAFNPSNAGYHWAVGGMTFVGRVAPGVLMSQLQNELRAEFPKLRKLNPLWDPGPDYRRDATVTPLQEGIVGNSGHTIWILFACVVVVLLISCANVANLLLARAGARERELSVRVALGGGRGRLIRQLVTESLLLAGTGALIGVGLAYVALDWFVASLPSTLPRSAEISINGTVLAFTALIAVLTGVLFGTIPALRATKSAGTHGLVGRRTTASAGHHRIAGMLVAVEMALAVMLVISATLLSRSLGVMQRQRPGFEASGVVAARLTPPSQSYQDPAKVFAFYKTVLARLGAVPGVTSVSAVDKLPLAETVWGGAIRVEGQFEDATRPLPEVKHWQMVTPRYFDTMKIPVRGRSFTEADREGQEPVAIISESIAKRFWPGGNAIGKRIGYPYPSAWITVIGVVPDIKQDSLSGEAGSGMYVPWEQRARMSGVEMWVLARTSGDASGTTTAIRAIVNDVDRAVPVSTARTLSAFVSDSMQATRFVVFLIGAFALGALFLAAIGIYGVMSYLVGQRAREMGIRMALGAPQASVMRMVVGRAASLAAVGAIIGVGLALMTGRTLRGFLYGVSAADPLTLAVVPLLLLIVAAAASAVPALRAMMVDPVKALRSDS